MGGEVWMGSSWVGDPSSDGLALVCEQADQIRAALGGAADLVDRVLEAARSKHELRRSLDALHEAILASGDVLGVYGQPVRHVSDVGMAGVSQVPMEAVYVCPVGHCSRYVWAEDAEQAPTCRVSGRHLRRERLP